MFGKKETDVMERQEQAVVTVTPACDITETGEGITVTAEVPGCTREGVNVTLEKNILSITAHADNELAGGVRSGKDEALRFERSFRIGRDLDQERISARVENGVLTVQLPRKESEKPRRIAVE